MSNKINPLESKLEDYLTAQCELYHIFNRKLEWVGHTNAPDRLLIGNPGNLVFVELKRKHGVVSSGQEHEHKILKHYRQKVYVPRTREDIDHIIEVLK